MKIVVPPNKANPIRRRDRIPPHFVLISVFTFNAVPSLFRSRVATAIPINTIPTNDAKVLTNTMPTR